MSKYIEWAEKIAAKLIKENLLLVEDDGYGEKVPSVVIDEASTGSVYATYWFNNGRSFLLRLADHKMGCMGRCDFWAEKYRDAEAAVFAAAA